MTNRLARETSPYLLQHADNPVDWHPWSETALHEARESGKPILLSIGYSACHWCHVMAHESFEDDTTARLMNENFVNIKVDREERPDLDKIYQLAHQVLTRRPGGWPLTVFLNPSDRMPFFAGTYFPGSPRPGLASFRDVLERVHAWYQENKGALNKQNEALGNFFRQVSQVEPAAAGALSDEPLRRALAALHSDFDERRGGFGTAPKFPQPPILELLLHQTGEAGANQMLTRTLDAMARGGLFDHPGGGFFRYCVDADWTIPHFEKMLYDNAQLLRLYAQAAVVHKNDEYRRVADATAHWVMGEMQSTQGGFYSSLDADSEGEEGKYYVWTQEQVRSFLNNEEWALFAAAYGLDGPPNFERKAWHLQRGATDAALAQRFKLDAANVAERLEATRNKLIAAREQRTPPGLDDKQLTSWNALMIHGLAQAGRLLDKGELTDAADAGLEFIRRHLWRDGRLLASFKGGEARLRAYLDDYAFTLAACIELLQARWNTDVLHFARGVADALLAHFQDTEQGGFYFTPDDHESLIQRPRPLADEATPSGNGIAAQALLRLGHLLAEPRYLEAAENTLRAAWSQLKQAPHAHPSLMIALQDYLEPPQHLILRGPEADLPAWRESLREHYRPGRSAFAIPNEAEALPEILSAYRAVKGVTAWLCTGTQCSAPVADRQVLVSML